MLPVRTADHRRSVGVADRPLALVGLPGVGKSLIGARLAHRLGWTFVDTDALVEAEAGRSVAEIFATEGEAGFRRRELAALHRALVHSPNLVLACGGGIVTHPPSAALLHRRCLVVWLDADDAALLGRLGAASDRPLLRGTVGERLAELRRQRSTAYARAAVRVDATADPDAVCEHLLAALSGAKGTTAVTRPSIWVELGERRYPVVVGVGVVESVAEHLPPGTRRVAVLVDAAVADLGRRTARALRRRGLQVALVRLHGGERLKTWAVAGRVLERLARLQLERGDCVVAVGGGSLGDLAGFVAATYQRGLAHVQVPTTLLAMVDSAIGGKTAVNLRRGKNLVGAFWQPRAVVCDLRALWTLPPRPYRAAFAEIVKYAMVADAGLALELDATLDALLGRDLEALASVVSHCCRIKAQVVAEDERDGGRRAILNYGHTMGHALETVTGHGDTLLHGEAVACGMRVAGRLSARLLGCPAEDVAWQDDVLGRCGLGTVPPVDPDRVLAATHADKKRAGGVVRWVLVERRGRATPGHPVDDAAVRSAWVEVTSQ